MSQNVHLQEKKKPGKLLNFYSFASIVLVLTVTFFLINYKKHVNHYKKHISGDTASIRKLFDSSFRFTATNPDSGLIIGKEALLKSKKSNWAYGEAISNNSVASNFFVNAKFDSSLPYFLSALHRNREIKNRKSAASNYNNLGICYIELGDYRKALIYLDSAEAFYSKAGVDYIYHLATVLSNKGSCYQHLKDYKKAIEYAERSIKFYKQVDEQVAIGDPMNNLANGLLAEAKDYKTAMRYYIAAEEILKVMNPLKIAAITMNKGLIYLECPDSVLRSFNINSKSRLDTSWAMFRAAEYGAKENGDSLALAFVYLAKSDWFAKKGNDKAALEWYTKFDNLHDSLVRNTIKIDALEAQFLISEESRKRLEAETEEKRNDEYFVTLSILFPTIPLIFILAIVLLPIKFKRKEMIVTGVANLGLLLFSEAIAFWMHFILGHDVDRSPLVLFLILFGIAVVSLFIHHYALGLLHDKIGDKKEESKAETIEREPIVKVIRKRKTKHYAHKKQREIVRHKNSERVFHWLHGQ